MKANKRHLRRFSFLRYLHFKLIRKPLESLYNALEGYLYDEMPYTALEQRVWELEKENAELLDDNDYLKDRLADVEDIY